MSPPGPTTSVVADLDTLSEEGLTILQTAVRVVRDEQIRRLADLRRRLSLLFPEKEQEIQQALLAWSRYERSQSR